MGAFMKKIKNFDFEKCWEKIYKNIKKEDLLIIATIFIFGLVNYFYFLSNVVLTHDSLSSGHIYKSGGWELKLGRPLLLIIDRLRGGVVSPTIIVFFALIFLSISAMIIRRIYPIKKKLSLFLMSLLIVLFPTFSESSVFIYCFDGYCLAFLCSILGIYYIKNKKYLFSIFSIIVSLSLYQAYISVTITGVLFIFILDILEKKQSLKNFIIQMFIVLIGLVSYYILLKLGMAILGRSLSSYKGTDSFGLATIIALPQSIINAYVDFYSFFMLENIIYNEYYYRFIINIVVFLMMLLLLFPKFKNLTGANKLLLIFALGILPITVNIMDLIACETRIILITGIGFLMIYLFFIILVEKYCKIPIVKSLSIIFVLCLCHTYLLSNNGTFLSRVDIHNHYYAQSTYILNKAKNLEGYNSKLPWMFNNTIRYKSPAAKASNGFLANYNETLDGYLGVRCNIHFYKRFLGEDIHIVYEDTYREIIEKEEYKSMNVGDVKIIDGIIVVKVSEYDIYDVVY